MTLFERRAAQILWDLMTYLDELVMLHEAAKDLDRANDTRNALKAAVGELIREVSEDARPVLTDDELLSLVARDVGDDATDARRSAYRKINRYLIERGR